MKMSLLLALTAMMCSLSVPQQTDIKLEIGAVLDKKYVVKKTHCLHNTDRAQTDPCIYKVIDGINYLIAYDKKSHKITYIYIRDRNFKTVEGWQVGKVLELRKEQVTVAREGGGIYAPETTDGWKPLIGFKIPPYTIEGMAGEVHWDKTEGFLKADVIHVPIWGFVKNTL